MSTSDSLMNQAVARALRGLRGEAGVTLDEVAEVSGLSLSTVRRNMKGSTDINATNLAALAGAMGTTPDEVLARVFRNLDYEEALADAIARISGRKVSEVTDNIIDMDEKRAAARLDQQHTDGTGLVAADINEEIEHDEPESP